MERGSGREGDGSFGSMGIKTAAAQMFFGRVMHGRLFPKKNYFSYGIYYLNLPLGRIKTWPVAYNRFAPLSFYDRDHGACDGSSLEDWARGILKDYGLNDVTEAITLVCMPRVLGYVFNPVSFWLCRDKEGHLRAVICEVHNTFGERHSYICAHDDQRVIAPQDILEAEKIFHVSPLLKRDGHYTFRFDVQQDTFGVWIDFYDADGAKQLVTSLVGQFKDMNKMALRRAFWRYPLVTVKAVSATKGVEMVKK